MKKHMGLSSLLASAKSATAIHHLVFIFLCSSRYLEEKEERKKEEAEKKKEIEEEKRRDQIINCLESMNKLLMVEVQLKRAEQRHMECYSNEIELKSHLSEAMTLLSKIEDALDDS